MPTRFLINQCQIITFLILKSDIIENSRIELRGIVLPVPSTWYICDFFLFHIELEGKCGFGGCGGSKGYIAPSPLKSPSSPPPSSYTYATADAKGSATALPELRSGELKTQLHMHMRVGKTCNPHPHPR